MSESLPVIVLGGSGYVAGELLRLIATHPRLHLGAAVSTSQVDMPLATSFAHLSGVYPDAQFVSYDHAVGQLGESAQWVVLSAAPHGASAGLIDRLLSAAETANVKMAVVDTSADFRFADAAGFEAIYKQPHPAPQRLSSFRCAVPEHLAKIDTPHAAQPGCFATAMLLGIVPLLAHDLCEPEFFVSAVTGSTGAGRTPRDTTHHPLRQSNLFAYQPLKHRHQPEVRALAHDAVNKSMRLHFVPQSGPFARGIHATIFARRTPAVSEEQIVAGLTEYYADSAFVSVADSPPRLKDIVGTNNAILSVAVDAETVAVCCVLDNLVKGAAGGAIQWVNRLFGWPDAEGLIIAPAGWV
ncbi:MAG: N-acetyl-gamma-glutamyl-phosphate reductase [Gammaproteobacteria bacterium]|nr:N-acetyl-gamma-glutamyl-phosphate reductase [Gammaproteobacteria bacterium]